MPASSTGFPTSPVVDQGGNLTPAWRAFLLALFNRTGSGVGVSTGAVSASLTAETQARSAADIALGGEIASETSARVAAVTNEATARANADIALGAEIAALAGAGGAAGTDIPMLNRWWFGR